MILDLRVWLQQNQQIRYVRIYPSHVTGAIGRICVPRVRLTAGNVVYDKFV